MGRELPMRGYRDAGDGISVSDGAAATSVAARRGVEGEELRTRSSASARGDGVVSRAIVAAAGVAFPNRPMLVRSWVLALRDGEVARSPNEPADARDNPAAVRLKIDRGADRCVALDPCASVVPVWKDVCVAPSEGNRREPFEIEVCGVGCSNALGPGASVVPGWKAVCATLSWEGRPRERLKIEV